MLRISAARMVAHADVRARIPGWWKFGRIALFATMAALFASTSGAAVGSSYLYDELGRILEVTTADGNTSQYKYDASGNLVSVTSVGGTVTVADFTPRAAVVGTPVVITGSGFSTSTSAPNTVTFGASTGVAVVAPTATQLTAMVPADATTGFIKVSNGSSTGTSLAQFTVLGSSATPSIGSFTPIIGPAGTAVQVNGKNFDLSPINDQLSFGATQASVSSSTATKMQTTVPVGAGSGGLLLRTPGGGVSSNADFFAVPAKYATANVVAGSRIAMNGSATTPTLAAGQVAMMLFDLNAGQSAVLSLTPNSGLSLGSISNILVTDPLGSTYVASTSGSAALSTGVLLLPQATRTGTYSIVVDLGANPGSVTLGLTPQGSSSMSIDQAGALHISHASPAPPIAVTFNNLSAGKQITLSLTANAAFKGDVHLVAPDGNTIASVTNTSLAVGDVLPFTPRLPLAGIYAITIVSNTGAAYDLSLTLVTSPAPGLILNGAAANVTVDQSAGTQTVTFSATPGQQVTVAAIPQSAPNGFTANLQVHDTSGQALQLYFPTVGQGTAEIIPGFLVANPQGVSTSGLYTVQLHAGTGKVAVVQVSATTPLAGGVLNSNGQALPVSPALVGQGAVVTFLGTDLPMTLTVAESSSSTTYNAQVFVLDQFGLPVGPTGLSATFTTVASGSTWTGSTSLAIPAFPQGAVYQVLVQQINASVSTNATLTFTLH